MHYVLIYNFLFFKKLVGGDFMLEQTLLILTEDVIEECLSECLSD